jgi:exosortase H (IPTLxxWG-CTERM-specific)
MKHHQSSNAERTREKRRRPALLFAAKLIGFLALLYAVTMIPWFRETVFPSWLILNADLGTAVLRVLGEDAQRTDMMVMSQRFALEVRRGCDAIEPIGLLIAAVLAFPARWRQRAVALALGVPLLLALNIVRIVSLFLIGAHAPSMFAVAHVEFWQTAFIIFTMFVWTMWACHVSRPRNVQQ